MRKALTGIAAAAALLAPAAGAAKSLSLSIDTSMAERSVGAICSGEPIDAKALRESALLRGQLEHNAQFDDRMTVDLYIELLRTLSKCETPQNDPFQFWKVVEKRDEIKEAIALTRSQAGALEAEVSKRLLPYAPDDLDFSSDVIFVAGSNSCGWAMDGPPYVDLLCTGADLEKITDILTHEVYHAMQKEFMSHFEADPEPSSRLEMLESLFSQMIIEGSAMHVMAKAAPDGNPAEPAADDAAARKFRWNARLLNLAAAHADDADTETGPLWEDIYLIGFSGNFNEPFYLVGAYVIAALDALYGAEALVCLMQSAPEQYVLAYDAALEDPQARARYAALPAETVAVARAVAEERGRADAFRSCLP